MTTAPNYPTFQQRLEMFLSFAQHPVTVSICGTTCFIKCVDTLDACNLQRMTEMLKPDERHSIMFDGFPDQPQRLELWLYLEQYSHLPYCGMLPWWQVDLFKVREVVREVD